MTIRVFDQAAKTIAKAMKDLKLRNDLRDSWPLYAADRRCCGLSAGKVETRLTAEKTPERLNIFAGVQMNDAQYKEIGSFADRRANPGT